MNGINQWVKISINRRFQLLMQLRKTNSIILKNYKEEQYHLLSAHSCLLSQLYPTLSIFLT